MLALEELLVETDSDLSLVATIIVGFDDNGCLRLEYKIEAYDVPMESRIKYVSVDKDDAYFLAKKLGISLTKLPHYINKRYGIRPLYQAVPSEARTLFLDILDFYNHYGVRYQLENSL